MYSTFDHHTLPDTLASSCLQQLLQNLPLEFHAIAGDRFQQQGADLIATLKTLYQAYFVTPDIFTTWLGDLMQTIAKAIYARPASLQALDLQRSSDKTWFMHQDRLGYCAYVDRFGGTLQGVAARIPHLQELGVNYLHLLPFLKARAGENDGGFAVADFDCIEPSLGNMQDLQTLCEQLRDKGISLCSDFVLNHVADDHAWALAAKRGDPHYRDYFYHFPDRVEPDIYEQTLTQVFPQTAPGNFSFIPELNGWTWTTFYPYQWDLNYRNPHVFTDVVTALLQLANRGVEVFRLDSTAYLWKRVGTNCMNQPEAHQLLQCLRHIVEIAAPGVLLKAEAIVPTKDLPAYLGNAEPPVRECHFAYHSSLMAASWLSLAEQDVSLLSAVARGTPELPPQSSWITYVRCHDDIGWNVLRQEASLLQQNKIPNAQDRVQNDVQKMVQQRLTAVSRFYAGDGGFASGASFQAHDPAAVHGSVGMASALSGFARANSVLEKQQAQDRLLLLYGLCVCFGGMPLIYMGDEFAQGNDDHYQQTAAHAHDSRWLHRPYWDQYNNRTCNDPNHFSATTYTRLCEMLSWRRQLPQLAAHQARRLLQSKHAALFAFQRGQPHHPFLFLGNFSAEPMTLDVSDMLPNEVSHARIWQKAREYVRVKQPLILPAWSQLWLTTTTLTKETQS